MSNNKNSTLDDALNDRQCNDFINRHELLNEAKTQDEKKDSSLNESTSADFNIDIYGDFRPLKEKSASFSQNMNTNKDDKDLNTKKTQDIDAGLNSNFNQSFNSTCNENVDSIDSSYKKDRKKIKLIIFCIIVSFLLLAIFTIFSIYARNDDSKASSKDNKAFSVNSSQVLANLKKDYKNAYTKIPQQEDTSDINLEKQVSNTQDQSFSTNQDYDAQYFFNDSSNDNNSDDSLALKNTRRANFLNAMSASSKVSISLNNSFNSQSLKNNAHNMKDTFTSNSDPFDNNNTYITNEQGENSNASIRPKKNDSLNTIYDYDALTHDAYTLNHKVQGIKNPYTLRQGTVIPAILLTGINSQLPGQVTAQVTRDVYDSPYGKFLLIPKGSKIIGQYLSEPKIGHERAMLGFNRIIFPDARALNIGSMPAMGLDGMSGLDADVNTHFMRLISYSVLLGGINTTISLNQRNKYDKDGNITLNSAASESLTQSLGQTLSDIVTQNMSIAPTLEVKAGFAFNVTLTKDIFFQKPYKDYNY